MNAIVIEQSADDARLAFEVHRNVDIHRLRLSRSRLDAPIPHAPADEESSRSISVSFTYGSKALQAPPGALRLEVRFRMTGTVESQDLIAAGDAPPQAKKSDRAIFVECVWEVDYLLKGEFRISDEQTKAFKDGNAIFNAWPYFREYLQSSMERMGLPPLAAPFLRLEPRLPGRERRVPHPRFTRISSDRLMEFRIADTFTDSLARLAGDEQKAVKTAAFDLQMNPAQPSLQLHRVDKSKDRNFWSARVSLDLRLIVHRTESSMLLCYVHHHDEAYDWARRRKLETHPSTGAAQLVELRETVQEIVIPKYVEVERPKLALFANTPESDLLACGVPPEWIAEVRKADEDTLLILAQHLPAEAAEALLDLAVGAKPKTPTPAAPGSDPFRHPDAERRFRVVRNVEELERALDYPWDKWTVFLHPAQRRLVERNYNGPARVAGSAGTGKTIVALHRAAALARKYPDARILLTTFSEPLASALRAKLQRLLGNEPRLGERVEVHSMSAAARRLYRANFNGAKPDFAPRSLIRDTLADAASAIAGHKFTVRFLFTEWDEVVDAWQLDTWESYRDVPRLGRKTRLPETQRAILWEIFSATRTGLTAKGLVTEAAIFTQLATRLSAGSLPPFDFVVVDESQDVSIAQLRFLAALGRKRPDALFFAGDLGQRIFQQPFSWKALGVDIRGRSTTLRINYRTSHQIRAQADRLLGASVADVDANIEERKSATSVFNGPPPVIRIFESTEAENAAVGQWLAERLADDKIQAHEIGIFVRSEAERSRAVNAILSAGLKVRTLDNSVEITHGHASTGTMHLAKGLEFRAVVVMACDDDVIPSSERLEAAADDSDLEEVYNTERHLLYVACTRARDHLLVTGVKPASEFLDDLRR